MKLFDKIFGSVGKALTEDAEKPQETGKEKEKETTQALEPKEELLKTILKTVSKFFEEEDETAGKKLIVWLDIDQLTFDEYAKFSKRILHALVIERGYKFEDVTIKIGKPAEALRCTQIHPNGKEFIQITDNIRDNINVVHKAIITISDGRGSLKQEKYEISSDDMKQQNIGFYNIGAGECPAIKSGYRQNHIAIDDDPNSATAELNKFVSRSHARIGYSDKFGFYLQAELDGTRQMGKRTRIFRNGKFIEMDNPEVREPLINGDIIELGKAVCLKFIEIIV